MCKLEMKENMNITEKKKYRTRLKHFKKDLSKYILTSRFNNSTYMENHNYRQHHNNIGCIYCSPSRVSDEIPLERIMFVLEMNNDTNKIVGIGMVRNHEYINKYMVYQNSNYNRYVYVGKHRIDRCEMTKEENTIMQALDILCFTGNTHMKRGQGLRQFPLSMVYNIKQIVDLVSFINDMFKKRLTENENK